MSPTQQPFPQESAGAVSQGPHWDRDDIVKRLRLTAGHWINAGPMAKLASDAADEIEQLRTKNYDLAAYATRMDQLVPKLLADIEKLTFAVNHQAARLLDAPKVRRV